MNLHQIHWYIPSLYGDIRLTASDSIRTEIEWENLSPSERTAMSALGKKCGVDTLAESGKLALLKPIAKVESVLVKAVKPGRKLLSAVVFKSGRVEEMHRADEVQIEKKDEPKAVVTVAAPMLGCPIPEFERAEVRATRVLREFLTPQQLADFERTQSFLVTGGDSGRQYVLTSRHAPAERLAKVGGRSVFDLSRRLPVCVHDWVVPAAEELLELKLFLELPNRETYVNSLPE